jgi:hypothetical protein
MANTAYVTSTQWIEDAAQYTAQHIGSPKAQIALCIYAMSLELSAIGGTDYHTGSAWETLVSTSDGLTRWMNPDQIAAAEINIRFQTAKDNGDATIDALVDAGIDAKMEAIKKLLEYDDQRLHRAKAYLVGALGRHTAF